MKLFTNISVVICCLSLAVAGCTQQRPEQKPDKPETSYTNAVAVIHPVEGNSLSGTVTFEKDSAGITINASVSGLESMSKHGFHIHRYGNCTANDFSSAGGHYDPDGDAHGEPGPNSHDGDLGNLVANQNGDANVNFTSTDITLNGPKSIIGRGIIVHANADDMESQPSGAAGPRIGCGVIGIAEAPADTATQM